MRLFCFFKMLALEGRGRHSVVFSEDFGEMLIIAIAHRVGGNIGRNPLDGHIFHGLFQTVSNQIFNGRQTHFQGKDGGEFTSIEFQCAGNFCNG